MHGRHWQPIALQRLTCRLNTSGEKMSSEVAVRYRACVYPFPRISLIIDDAQPVDDTGIKQLLKHIRPDWPTDRIQFKVHIHFHSLKSDFLFFLAETRGVRIPNILVHYQCAVAEQS